MRNAGFTAAVLAVLSTTPVAAICSPPKLASTFNDENYVYIDMGPGITNNQVVGAFYQAGDAAGNHNGTYAASEWLFVDVGGLLSMNANLGDARVVGCPSGVLVTRVQTTTRPIRFLTMTASQGAGGPAAAQFDYSVGLAPGSVLSSAPIPRPRVINVTRTSSEIDVTLLLDPTASGAHGAEAAVVGYEVLRKLSVTDPGHDPTGWTVLADVPNDGSGTTVTVPVTCGTPDADEFLATRLKFGDDQRTDVVSDSTRISCHPTLAEPRFNLAPKRPVSSPKKSH